MKKISTCLTLSFLPFLFVCAEEYDKFETQHIRMFETAYKESIGKRVMVDVLVWHYLGTSGRGGGEVITPTGQVIYIRDAYKGTPMSTRTQVLPQGKLVRITGTLEFGPAPTLSVDGKDMALRTGDSRSHLNLRLESFELIESAEFPWPRRLPENPRSEQGDDAN
ncbi:MAG TPA: hypothetical protein PLA50_01375 [Bacteroidia bacterium]|nr:hypothetical protein [Bacteroidia bacterium]